MIFKQFLFSTADYFSTLCLGSSSAGLSQSPLDCESEQCQYFDVDTVRFGQASGSLGKVARLAGIDAGDRQAGLLEFGSQAASTCVRLPDNTGDITFSRSLSC